MSNPKRGELEIVLGEKKYKGKVTLDVAIRIEQSCGMGIVKVTQALSEGSLTTSQMIAIITPVIRAGGNDVSDKQVGEALWTAGVTSGITVVGAILTSILSVGGDEGNEEQAEVLL